MRSRNGSSGFKHSLSLNDEPSSSGQNADGNDAVGAEHDDQPLLAPLLIREAQTGQVQDEREGRCADAQIADKLASVASMPSCQLSGRQLAAYISAVLTLEFTTLDPRGSKPTLP